MPLGDPTYPLFPTFALLGFLAGLIPLPWHLQAWNAGTCSYMIWASFASLIEFVDSILWNGNIDKKARVWCDISTKFLIGAGVGIPASSLCINRRLYKIASIQSVTTTRAERRKAIFVDLAISFGVPTLIMILHTVVQGHRFNIIEDIGCTPDIWNTAPAYPLVFMWPPLLGCISFVYAGLSLRAFWIQRAQFSELLSSSSSMTISRYFRLMLLCCIEMALTVPLGSFSIYINTAGLHIAPYISWANAHYDFGYIEVFPSIVWMSNRAFFISAQMGRYIYPCSAFLFFSLFGFADEARKHYRLAFWWVAKRFGFHPPPEKRPNTSWRGIRTPKLTDDDALPPYSPERRPTHREPPSPVTTIPSLTDVDLEKGVPSPSSSYTPDEKDCPSFIDIRRDEADPDNREDPKNRLDEEVETSDERSTSRTSVSQASPDVVPGVPSYHRPFSPLMVGPPSADDEPEQEDSLKVMVHTEYTYST